MATWLQAKIGEHGLGLWLWLYAGSVCVAQRRCSCSCCLSGYISAVPLTSM